MTAAASWPLPALLAWVACWIVFLGVARLGAGDTAAMALALVLGALIAVAGTTPWRRVFIGAGFPISLAATGVAGTLPAWAWLLPLALLAGLYPLRAWRDAPVFPTPRGALRGLAGPLRLPAGCRVLDAGCGFGNALAELRLELPDAELTGIEWSWPLWLVSTWRCRFARVRRADMWRTDWSAFDLVYVFQRPESMAEVAAKASREMRPGAWLASLEFEIVGRPPSEVLACADGRPLWLYRMDRPGDRDAGKPVGPFP